MRKESPFLREADPCSAVKKVRKRQEPPAFSFRAVSWSLPISSHLLFQVIDTRVGLRDEELQNGGPRRLFSKYKCDINI